jgi:predicted component of type VI protein secretion system
MALDLHVAGPGLDVHRRLEPGEPALILGRDTDCAICLPDPERNISRRHLSVWNEGDQLHFHVLSVVNGVEISSGELPPGARGILPPGEVLGLSAFRIVVAPMPVAVPMPATDDDGSDPWAEFARQVEQLAPEGPETVPASDDDEDPFGDWGFQSTFGPGSPSGGLRANALLPAADLGPFLAGLGMAQGQGAFTQGELETMGRLTRIALQGLLQVAQAAAESRRETRAEDRTMAEPRELNPLRLDTSIETKLYYLFGGQAAAAGFMPPDRAVAQVVAELSAHQQAMADAVREAVQKIVEEFDPEAMKKRLLGGGARIFESARAWDAFVKDYAERMGTDPQKVQSLLDRHFARAYARAIVRAKRNTTGRPAT